ncbi:50S ribosomal protein L23 [Candidatus Parcubacteria bacterium]|jgi:large subunit ribosomal protein L23|nr:50S ribosomal protein L23 [Candidatus Parcubacteria bacterium]MBT7228715.1 50S ribosomal protein L23 [Candidatus Parcubacteria bacterium]
MGLFSKKNTDDKKEKEADKKSVVKEVAKKEAKPVKTVKAKKPVAKKVTAKPSGYAYRVLIKPIISEKATMGTSLNKYVFEISAKSNKIEVKKAIEEIYGVVPVSINVLNQRGKSVRSGRRFGRTKDIKKAVVTLRKGDSIKLYEGI